MGRYRQTVSDLGSAPIDIAQGREIIAAFADRTPVRPGADCAADRRAVANEEMPLAQVAGDSIQIRSGSGGLSWVSNTPEFIDLSLC